MVTGDEAEERAAVRLLLSLPREVSNQEQSWEAADVAQRQHGGVRVQAEVSELQATKNSGAVHHVYVWSRGMAADLMLCGWVALPAPYRWVSLRSATAAAFPWGSLGV